MDQELLKILESKPLQSLPVVGFFSNYPVEKRLQRGSFLLLTGTSDYPWAYLCGDNPEELITILDDFDFETSYFANVEDWMMPILTQNRKIEWKLTTHRYYISPDVKISQPTISTRQLEPSMARQIFENSDYKDFTSVEYISDRLEKDVSAGVWVNGQLAGWGLTHDDSSLGFLNVLPEYRGQGLGENLLRGLAIQKRNNEKPVFVNVEPHNQQSIKLIKKIGFSFDREVSWIKLA